VTDITQLAGTVERWLRVVIDRCPVRRRREHMQRRDGIGPQSRRTAIVVGLALAAIVLAVIAVRAASGGSGGGLY
jgi:hypothetical protein